MRIAIVAGGIPLGGSTTFILYLASALRVLGVPVEVFSFTANNPFSREFSGAGVPVHVQDEKRLIYEDRLQSLYQALCVFDPSVVVSVLGVESYEMLRYLPVGVMRIGIILDMAIKPQNFVSHYAHTMDHIVVIARYLVGEVLQAKEHPPVTHLQLGIPITANVAPREPNLNAPLRLLYYGRLENASKGVRLFPDIVAALNRRRVPFRWTIHGWGPEGRFLEQALALDVRKGNIIFSDHISYAQLPSVIRSHDVYMLTSTNEGGPLTLLESMTLGLVPICGDIPGLVEDVINSENGFRVPRADPEAYAEAIEALHSDRALLERMSQAARATITKEFSAEEMAHRYIRFLESLNPTNTVVWPERIRVRPILGQGRFRYTAAGRGLRRLMKAFS